MAAEIEKHDGRGSARQGRAGTGPADALENPIERDEARRHREEEIEKLLTHQAPEGIQALQPHCHPDSEQKDQDGGRQDPRVRRPAAPPWPAFSLASPPSWACWR